MVISKDDQIERPQLNINLSLRVRICVRQIMIGSQGRKALPTVEMWPVHKSLDRILRLKNYTNHCATPAGAKHSQPGSSQKPSQEFTWVYFPNLFLSLRSDVFDKESHS